MGLGMAEWKTLLILNVALTIPARVLIGALTDKICPPLGLLCPVDTVLHTLLYVCLGRQLYATCDCPLCPWIYRRRFCYWDPHGQRMVSA